MEITEPALLMRCAWQSHAIYRADLILNFFYHKVQSRWGYLHMRVGCQATVRGMVRCDWLSGFIAFCKEGRLAFVAVWKKKFEKTRQNNPADIACFSENKDRLCSSSRFGTKLFLYTYIHKHIHRHIHIHILYMCVCVCVCVCVWPSLWKPS